MIPKTKESILCKLRKTKETIVYNLGLIFIILTIDVTKDKLFDLEAMR